MQHAPMMFGEAGLSLLEDAKADSLRAHAQAEIKTLESENARLEARMEEIKERVADEISEELSVNYIMLKYFRERNKRILRCYSFHRVQLLFDAFFSKMHVGHLLSCDEEDLARRYHAVLRDYLDSFPMLDFSAREPPIQFFVQIVTLEDCGLVMDGESLVELRKNRIYFIKRSAVMHLINEGLVQIV